MRRSLVVVAVALMLVVVAGAGFRAGLASREPIVHAPRRVSPVPRQPGTPATPPAPLPASGRLVDLEARITELETEIYGVPVPWDDTIPEPYRPEAVTAGMAEVIAECGGDVELVAVDCAEAPCHALVERFDDPEAGVQGFPYTLAECPAWMSRWTATMGFTHRDVTCDDGTTHRLTLLTPGLEAEEMDDLLRPRTAEDRAFDENLGKRTAARADLAEMTLCQRAAR